MAPTTILLEENSSNELAVRNAQEVLAGGGVVAFPTDTVYGLGVDGAIEDAVECLYEIKKRDRSKPLVGLAASKEHAKNIAPSWSPLADALAVNFWPGALTIISGGVGLRVPDLKIARDIASTTKGSLLTTSANISGETELLTTKEIIQTLGDSVDLILDDTALQRVSTKPSTVVLVDEDAVKILRVGAITEEMINEAIK